MTRIRIASFDFGPIHTSLCIIQVDKDTLSDPRIEKWEMINWRDKLIGSTTTTSQPPPSSLSKPLATLKKDDILAELQYWKSTDAQELASKTRVQLLAELRRVRKIHRPNIRKTFFSSYAEYIDMVCRFIQFDTPVDIVLLEHQAANFRYENMVVESMVAQHIFTWHHAREWQAPTFRFLPGAFKFKPFLLSEPKPKAKYQRKKKMQRLQQHELNKAYSLQKCMQLLEERQFHEWKRWLQQKVIQGDKCDDLADAYLQLEAYLRTEDKPRKRKRSSNENSDEHKKKRKAKTDGSNLH